MVRAISPELVLVDPDLAGEERARLVEGARLSALLGDARSRTEVVPLPLGSASTVVPARKARTRDLVLLAVMVASLAANGVLASLVIARNGSSARLAGSVSSAPGPGDMGLRTTRPVTRGGARNGVVERHLIRWLARAPIAAIPTPLRSGRSTNSFETVCLPAGTPGSYRCVVHVVGQSPSAVFAVKYPAPAEGGALVERLR